MFTTIAWATDLSPSAHNALTTATELARRFGAKLALVHVREVIASRAGIFVDSPDGTADALHETARDLRAEGIDTDVLVTRAPVSGTARAIVDLATRAGAGLIVVGNRGTVHWPGSSWAVSPSGCCSPRRTPSSPCRRGTRPGPRPRSETSRPARHRCGDLR